MKKSNYYFRGMTLLLFLFSIMTYGQTFNGSGGGAFIASNTCISPVPSATVSGLAAGTNLASVNINISHTYDGDLDIYLIAPNGTSVELTTDNGGGGDNYINTVFSDAGSPINSGSAPFTGTYSPEQPLSTVAGQGNGVWQLNVCDDAGGDTGTLNAWSLTFGATGPPPGPVYCTANPSINDGQGMTNIEVGNFSQSLPDITYHNLTGSPVQLQQGTLANTKVSYSTGSYPYSTYVWVDFDDDGTFNPGDLVFSGLAPGNGTLDASFPMPAGAPLGEHRMRIVGGDGISANPCYSGSWAVALDIDIEVIEQLCQQATIAGTEIVPDCNNAIPGYSVDVNIASGGDAEYITDGTTTWYIDNIGINNVGPFANDTSVNLTVVHTNATCNINLGSFVYNCPPANNDCDGAIAVGCGETYSGNTQYASISATPGSCGSTSINTAPGVWHTVVGTGGDIIIDTNDSGYDTKLGLFSGACGALVCIDSDDDGGDGTRSQITFSSNAGETYYVYVTGYLSNTGAYNLTVDCVCDVVIEGGSCQSVYSSSFAPLASTNLTATGLFGAGGFTYLWSDGQVGATISVNPTENTEYQVIATDAAGCTSTAQVTVLVVDVSCNNGNEDQDKVTVCHYGDEICVSANAVQSHLNHGDTIGSCDGPAVSCDTPPLCDSILKVPSPGAINIPTSIEISWGQATGYVVGYVLSVGTTPGGTDIVNSLDVGTDLSYALSGLDFNTTYYVTVVPYNDNGSAVGCDQSNSFTTVNSPWSTDAIPLTCASGSVAGNVLDGYINDYLASCTGTINDAAGVWYSFEGNGDDIILSTCGTPWDTYISVFEGNDSSITCNGSDDDNFACSGFGSSSEYEFTSVVGTTYYIFVTSFSSFTNVGSGDFTLSLTCIPPPPPPQACIFAESIDCNSSVSASTVGFDVNDFDSCGTSINTAPGRFYKVEGTGGNMIASLCDSTFDTKIAVFSGNCSALICVGGNDDFCGTRSSITFPTVFGDIYYIYVTGYNSNAGDFTLNVSCPLPPDPLGGEVDCGGSGLTQEYCYGNNESSSISYSSSNGSPLTLEFNSGIIEASTYDFIKIYDGVDASGTLVYQNGTSYGYNLSGDTATAPSGNMFVSIVTDSSVSCQSGSSSATTWNFNVYCAGSSPIVASTSGDTWSMYPNPASNGEVELDLTNYLNTDLDIQMMDFSGKLLINNSESNLQNPRYKLSTQSVSNGMYFVRVVTESGISIKKLIIAN